MTRDQGALHGPTWARNPVRPVAPVLIQVPALSMTARRSVRPPVRRRRRLRREVRALGSALMFGVPTLLAFVNLGGGRPPATAAPVAAETARPALAVAAEAPAAWPSIEPAGLAPTREPQAPVILPGYILPDDGTEEPAHAGS